MTLASPVKAPLAIEVMRLWFNDLKQIELSAHTLCTGAKYIDVKLPRSAKVPFSIHSTELPVKSLQTAAEWQRSGSKSVFPSYQVPANVGLLQIGTAVKAMLWQVGKHEGQEADSTRASVR